jgi:protein-disulfide isomerase
MTRLFWKRWGPADWARIHCRRGTAATTVCLVLGFFACALLVPFASAQEGSQPQGAAPLAVLAGQPIDESQLPPDAQRQLQNMEQQVFAVRHRALQTVLDQKLIAAEAKEKGVTVEELFKDEVESKVADPTEDEVATYYELHKAQINKPLDEARESIRRDLKTAALNKASQLYLRGLMEEAIDDGELAVFLRPPRLVLPVDPTRLKGNPKAPVTIVEFSDFSCAACQKAESTIAEILVKYPDKIQVSFHDFPFQQSHPGALLSAEAARCAGEQDKFWEYHDLLFSNLTAQSPENLVKYAGSLKLDDQKFEACLNSGRHESDIEQDLQLGFRAGVLTPPGIFINGRFLDGGQSLIAIEKIIDQELAGEQSHPSQ